MRSIVAFVRTTVSGRESDWRLPAWLRNTVGAAAVFFAVLAGYFFVNSKPLSGLGSVLLTLMFVIWIVADRFVAKQEAGAARPWLRNFLRACGVFSIATYVTELVLVIVRNLE